MTTENISLEQLTTIIESVALLLDDFKTQTTRSGQYSEEQAKLLHSVLTSTSQEIEDVLQKTEGIIKERATKAILSSTAEAIEPLEKNIKRLCNDVALSAESISKSAKDAHKLVKVQSFILIGASCLLSAIAIGGATWLTKKKIDEGTLLEKKNLSISHAVEVKQALNKANFTLCGESLCVQVKPDAPRYGKNGEYIILE